MKIVIFALVLTAYLAPIAHADLMATTCALPLSDLKLADNKSPLCQVMREDYELLEKLEFSQSSALYQQFFGSAGAAAYAKGHLKEIWLVNEEAAGADFAAMSHGDTLLVFPSYFTLKLANRLLVLVHEAKHREGKQFDHTLCPKDYIWKFGSMARPTPELADSKACDASDAGAYAYGFVFATAVKEFCTNCSPDMKTTAKNLAFESLLHITTPEAISRLIAGTGIAK